MSVWCLVSGVAPYNISILAACFFCQAFEQFKEAINEDLLKDAPATGFAATLVFRATVENAVKHIINIHPARKTNHLICGSDEGIKDAHKPGVGIALKVLRVSARRDVAAAVPTDEAESAHADLCTRMNKHTHQHTV